MTTGRLADPRVCGPWGAGYREARTDRRNRRVSVPGHEAVAVLLTAKPRNKDVGVLSHLGVLRKEMLHGSQTCCCGVGDRCVSTVQRCWCEPATNPFGGIYVLGAGMYSLSHSWH
jgi:hypothetical protein